MQIYTNNTEALRIDSRGNVGIGSGTPKQSFWVTDEPYKIVDHLGPEVIPGWTCIRSMDSTVEEFIQGQDPGLWRRCSSPIGFADIYPLWVIDPKLLTLLALKFSG